MSKANYEGASEVRPFVFLERGARHLNELAADPVGQAYTLIGAVVMTAFTFEAYLNHLGIQGLALWDDKERMPVMEKYLAICKAVGITPVFGRRPNQTLRSLFKFRNAMAHGKTEELRAAKVVAAVSKPHEHSPTTFWQKCLTPEFAKRAHEDVTAIIGQLHTAAGGDARSGPFLQGAASGVLTLIPSTKP